MTNCIMLVGKIKEFIKINNAVQIKIEIVRNEEKKDLIPIVAFDKLGEVLNDEKVLHLIAMYEEAIKQFELFKKENERFITASERNEKLESTLKEKYFLPSSSSIEEKYLYRPVFPETGCMKKLFSPSSRTYSLSVYNFRNSALLILSFLKVIMPLSTPV